LSASAAGAGRPAPDRAAPGADTRESASAVAERLASQHFAAQHEASVDLTAVEIAQLDPFLRSVLFTDGTVSRTLEAQALAHVAVDALEQDSTAAPARIARYLEIEQTDGCLRRRVVMTIAGTPPSVWAESYLVPGRLPGAFLARLDGDEQGIGGSLQQLKLESRRELLWFGLGPLPPWALDAAPKTALTRVYRVLTEGLPALLISESFAVTMRDGLYCLTSSTAAQADADTDAANGR
jgi:chorismate-pyruvate lyase